MSLPIDSALQALGIALALLTVPGTLLLLALTLAGLREPPSRSPTRRSGRLALIVPAHDEAAGIAGTIANLRAAAEQDGACDIVVVADNCSDATAERARAAGARTLERRDPHRRGKGYALRYAFERLLREGYELFVVVDADSRVAPGFVSEMRRPFEAGALAAQARYTVLNPEDSMRTRLMAVALAAFNILRPRGRAALGLSAGIYGNGFALHREALQAVPFRAGSVTEDLEYHLMLVRAGIKVEFVDGATVLAEMPATGRGVSTQRARWEGGRLRLAVRTIPALAVDVARGNWRLLEPLLDLALAPLAYHALALGVLLLLPLPWALAGAAGLIVLTLHVLAAARVAGLGPAQLVRALAGVPVYLLWKLAMLPRIARAAGRLSPWVRTARAAK